MKPRRNESTTGLPRKSDKRVVLPCTSSSSKSGASSPGVINFVIGQVLSGIVRWHLPPVFAGQGAEGSLHDRRAENHNRQTANGCRHRSPQILYLRGDWHASLQMDPCRPYQVCHKWRGSSGRYSL